MVEKTVLEKLTKQYRCMLTIRRFEEESARAYAQGKIGGFLHLYIGQEAIAVALCEVLRLSDYIFQSYRDHGIAIARGMEPKFAMAELFGKHTGCARGLGGSMHFFDPERNFLGGYGIVGGHIPLASGTAFKSKYRGEDDVTVCLFGEGATNIAGFHEALSLAGVWKLPAIFVCENNEYSMGTPMHRTSAIKDIADKAAGYGMRGVILEGHDVTELEKAFKGLVKETREGGGPLLVEIKTYRFRGHSISDPAKYRTKDEVEERKQRDPLQVLRKRMETKGAKAATFDKLAEEVESVVSDAIAFAEESEPAREESMWNSVMVPSFGMGEV